jgi:cysteinyl-tRNA synthetase
MSIAHLPQPLDIHCGGMDHIRVHHTNEIAQAEAATGQKFANFWLHGEFLVLDKGKMAKSGGNFVTLDTLKEKGISPLGYRMFCYTAHYRSPLTFSYEGAASAEQGLANLRKIISQLDKSKSQVAENVNSLDKSKSQVANNVNSLDKGKSQVGDNTNLLDKNNCQAAVNSERLNKALEPFMDAICDDLNMPRAVAALWDALRDDTLSAAEKRAFAEEADKVLGLDLLKGAEADSRTEITEEAEGYKISIIASEPLPPELKDILIEKAVQRKKSRAAKDFQTADEIRGRFEKAGITVKDLSDGTTMIIMEGTPPLRGEP